MSGPPDSDVIAIHYRRSFDRWGSLALELVREGPSSLALSFNSDGPPEVGLWQHALDPALFGELALALHASRYHELPTPPSPYPGMTPVSLGERRASGMPFMKSFGPVTPELDEVMACLARVEAELRWHPVRVLRAAAGWRSAEPARGSDVELELTLTNAGAEPLERENPLKPATAGWTGLRLGYLRPNREQVAFTDLSPREVHPLAADPAAPTLSLAPGQSASFLVRTRLPAAVRPGRYQPVLEVRSRQDCLWLEPGPLVVGAG